MKVNFKLLLVDLFVWDSCMIWYDLSYPTEEELKLSSLPCEFLSASLEQFLIFFLSPPPPWGPLLKKKEKEITHPLFFSLSWKIGNIFKELVVSMPYLYCSFNTIQNMKLWPKFWYMVKAVRIYQQRWLFHMIACINRMINCILIIFWTYITLWFHEALYF